MKLSQEIEKIHMAKKIDLYVDGQYLSTTTRYNTVKDAIKSLKGKDYIDVAGKGRIKIKGKKITGEIVK